ncbi:MAG: hypothetical protein LBK53_02945 [Heliobacteriaceae bacterium]|nr:hypothetical protein [Heliobacteriaceae bacterium]
MPTHLNNHPVMPNDRIVSSSDHRNIQYRFTSPYRRQMLKQVQHDVAAANDTCSPLFTK